MRETVRASRTVPQRKHNVRSIEICIDAQVVDAHQGAEQRKSRSRGKNIGVRFRSGNAEHARDIDFVL